MKGAYSQIGSARWIVTYGNQGPTAEILRHQREIAEDSSNEKECRKKAAGG